MKRRNIKKQKLNIVLVHGAWADGSSWSGVIERLQEDDYNVTAPQFPLTSTDAPKVIGLVYIAAFDTAKEYAYEQKTS